MTYNHTNIYGRVNDASITHVYRVPHRPEGGDKDVLAQAGEVDLLHGAEVQDPAAQLREGEQLVQR